jgi:type IV secretory pathway TraG/TraD family ATPase VirD4
VQGWHTVGLIPNFEKLIATFRSREISVSVILQAQSQLKAIYKDNMDTIIGNTDVKLFLGGSEKTTLKETEELLGKQTLHMYNTSVTKGNSESHGQNFQKVGRSLMSTDEIAIMDGAKCILQLRGVRPFLSDKYDIEKHPNYKYLADADPSLAFDIAEFVKPFKENREKLLKGENPKNIKYSRIVIGEDETPTSSHSETKLDEKPSDHQTDNNEDEAENDFDPNDTEII